MLSPQVCCSPVTIPAPVHACAGRGCRQGQRSARRLHGALAEGETPSKLGEEKGTGKWVGSKEVRRAGTHELEVVTTG